jgi:hypothetical protein
MPMKNTGMYYAFITILTSHTVLTSPQTHLQPHCAAFVCRWSIYPLVGAFSHMPFTNVYSQLSIPAMGNTIL